jgi:hypothetical protein
VLLVDDGVELCEGVLERADFLEPPVDLGVVVVGTYFPFVFRRSECLFNRRFLLFAFAFFFRYFLYWDTSKGEAVEWLWMDPPGQGRRPRAASALALVKALDSCWRSQSRKPIMPVYRQPAG